MHILPGVYRETAWPALSGSAAEPAIYRAENGLGTAILRGSEASSSLAWTQLAANTIDLPAGVDPTQIYYADLSAWNSSDPPRFVVQLDAGGQVGARLPLAHEPDWQVITEWKAHEFCWAADGGSSPAACDPATNSNHDCDLPQRSMTLLTDRTNDAELVGVEAGNLTTLGNLTGATLVAIDTVQGHYTYRQIANNIVVNNEGYGLIVSGANRTFSNVTLNHNLYSNNGWRSYASGGVWQAGDMVVSTLSPNAWTPYQTLAEIRANTAWEAQGVEGDLAFWSYDPADHDMHDGSWPDVHLTPASTTAIDRGTAALPASLTTFLAAFAVDDPHWGAAFDIGRYEGGWTLIADPSAQAIDPGGTAHYYLRLYPPDLPYAVTLAVTSPAPSLAVALSPTPSHRTSRPRSRSPTRTWAGCTPGCGTPCPSPAAEAGSRGRATSRCWWEVGAYTCQC